MVGAGRDVESKGLGPDQWLAGRLRAGDRMPRALLSAGGSVIR